MIDVLRFGAAICALLGVELSAGQFQRDSVVLYQPDAVLRARLPGAEPLAGYISRLYAVCEKAFATAANPELLDIVVAVKPGKRSRVWLVSSRASDDRELKALVASLEQVEPPEIRGGPIAFAIVATIAGATRPPVKNEEFQPPLPKEWQEAAKRLPGRVQIPDDILRIIWP